MSLYKINDTELDLERSMGRKQRVDYGPRLELTTTHPLSADNRTDHQYHMFDNYWREPLESRLKFELDPAARSRSYLAEVDQDKLNSINLVKQLDKVYDEPSDDFVVEKKRGKK